MDLKISLLQVDIQWEAESVNLQRFEQLINELPSDTDIAVFPEMFTTGFSMKASKIATSLDGQTVSWLKKQAVKHNIAIVAGVVLEELVDSNAVYRNTLVWVNPDGGVQMYDKRHLFRVAGEHKHYKQGEKKMVIEYKGWKIAPFICYDIRFPVWSRNVAYSGEQIDFAYDCAIYIANWPASRSLHWETLLKARAIENQAYVIGVNRVGVDNKGYEYSGNSLAISPKGVDLCSIPENKEVAETVSLDKEKLLSYRERFPFVLDADVFKIK